MALSLGTKIAGAAVAGAVLLGAGTMAWADGSGGTTVSPVTNTAATAPVAKTGQHRGGALQRADHGTVEIKVKGTSGSPTWQTFTFDRGKVTAISASQITLARPDGQSVTLTIGPDIKWNGVSSWQQVVTSKEATVVSENGKATIVQQRVAPAPGAGASAPSASADAGATPVA